MRVRSTEHAAVDIPSKSIAARKTGELNGLPNPIACMNPEVPSRSAKVPSIAQAAQPTNSQIASFLDLRKRTTRATTGYLTVKDL